MNAAERVECCEMVKRGVRAYRDVSIETARRTLRACVRICRTTRATPPDTDHILRLAAAYAAGRYAAAWRYTLPPGWEVERRTDRNLDV